MCLKKKTEQNKTKIINFFWPSFEYATCSSPNSTTIQKVELNSHPEIGVYERKLNTSKNLTHVKCYVAEY